MATSKKGSYEEFLDPTITRRRLTTAAVFIAAYEALKNAVIDRIRSFFSIGLEVGPEYATEVLAVNRSPLHASLQWLESAGAISADDVSRFERVKQIRNTLAHELFQAVAGGSMPKGFERAFIDMAALLRKIEVWWVVNVDMQVDPELADRDIEEDKIMPGPVMMLGVLLEVALGEDERSREYLEEYRRQSGGAA